MGGCGRGQAGPLEGTGSAWLGTGPGERPSPNALCHSSPRTLTHLATNPLISSCLQRAPRLDELLGLSSCYLHAPRYTHSPALLPTGPALPFLGAGALHPQSLPSSVPQTSQLTVPVSSQLSPTGDTLLPRDPSRQMLQSLPGQARRASPPSNQLGPEFQAQALGAIQPLPQVPFCLPTLFQPLGNSAG